LVFGWRFSVFAPDLEMSEHLQLVYVTLWSFHPLLEGAVAFMMWRRKLDKVFPAFYSFLLWGVIQFSILFPIFIAGPSFYEWYYYAFWTGMAVDVFLGFRVIHEIFLDVFRPYHTLKDLGTVLFKWAGLVMLLVSAVVAFSKSTVEQGPVAHAIFTLHQRGRLPQCGLVLFLLVFSRYLGISWRQKSFGLALGFGWFASVEMSVMVLNMGGYIDRPDMNIINLIAAIGAFIMWFGYMSAKSPERESTTRLTQSHRWEQSLTDLQRPVGADSLIPMFEGMVERAFSRSNGQSAVAEIEEPSPAVLLRSDPYSIDYAPEYSSEDRSERPVKSH